MSGRVIVEFEYDRLTCSICGLDLMLCAHVPGKVYDGRYCAGIIEGIVAGSFRAFSAGAIDPRGLR